MTDTIWKSTTGRPTEFGRISPPDPDWLTQVSAETPRLSVPVLDAHHHFWAEHGQNYGPQDLLADLDEGPDVVGTVHVECHAHYRPDGPEILKPVGETERVVAITAAAADPRLALGIVGFADLDLGDAVEEVLEAHMNAGAGRFRGIRFGTGWDPSPQIANTDSGDRPFMLTEPRIQAGARRLAALDLSLDVWLFHHQLGDVAVLANAVPELTIVLDHCGGHLGYGPYAKDRAEHFTQWRRGLQAIARQPNVMCKIGGLLARGAAFDYVNAPHPPTSDKLADVWRPWVETCIETFGADRCMFESNFPVDKMGVRYGSLWNCFARLAQGASPDEQRSLFAETAARTYKLDLSKM